MSEGMKRSYKNSPKRRKKLSQLMIAREAEKKRLLADAKRIKAENWRPEDWDDASIDRRIVGNELLSRPGYMSNEELVKRLLKGRLIDLSKYGKTATEILASRGFQLLVNDVRKWVKRPGKEGGRTRVNSLSTSA